MGAERALDVAEHPVTWCERGDDSPVSTTVPANSHPSTFALGCGSVDDPGKRGSPARKAQSVRFTVVALDPNQRSCLPVSGLATSLTLTTSGGPYFVLTAALMA